MEFTAEFALKYTVAFFIHRFYLHALFAKLLRIQNKKSKWGGTCKRFSVFYMRFFFHFFKWLIIFLLKHFERNQFFLSDDSQWIHRVSKVIAHTLWMIYTHAHVKCYVLSNNIHTDK